MRISNKVLLLQSIILPARAIIFTCRRLHELKQQQIHTHFHIYNTYYAYVCAILNCIWFFANICDIQSAYCVSIHRSPRLVCIWALLWFICSFICLHSANALVSNNCLIIIYLCKGKLHFDVTLCYNTFHKCISYSIFWKLIFFGQ